MSPKVSPLARARSFMGEGIWATRSEPLSRRRALGYRLLRVSYLVAKGFADNRCKLHASALTYTTLVSLVPFLAFVFAVAKGLKVQEHLMAPLQRLTLRPEIAERLIEYIESTDVRTLGTAGLLLLLFTVIQLLGTVEKTFNEIWGVQKERTLFRKFSDYLSVVVVSPLLLATALMMTAALESSWAVSSLRERLPYLADLVLLSFRLLPFAALWVVFTCLYLFMPNTRVPWRAALGGGLVAGTLWQVGQWLYIYGNIRLAQYNAIYSSFASFPFFLIWLYLSWLIALFGAEVAFALQHERTYQREGRASAATPEDRERLALQISGAVADRFRRGEPPWDVNALAQGLDLPVRLVQEIASRLEAAGILTAVAGPVPAYHPGRSLEAITVKQVLDALRCGETTVLQDGMGSGPAKAVLAAADEALASRLGSLTLDDFAKGKLPTA